MTLLGGEGFRRALGQVAGDGFFGAADGHFVEAVLAKQRLAGGRGDVSAHLVQLRLAEEGAFGIGARAHVVERGFLEEGFGGVGVRRCGSSGQALI